MEMSSRPAARFRDPALIAVLVAAALLSIGACVVTALSGTTLAYADAMSHLLITGRVSGASTPGAAQLGGVWLPLPHLLAAPLVEWDPLLRSGIGACALSMGCYVAATGWLYQAGRGITGKAVGGVVAAAVFATNPNVLYLQSTPMTEVPMLAGIAATIACFVAWCRTDRLRYLLLCALATMLTTLVRYEGWVLLPVLVAAVGWRSWRRAGRWHVVRADLVLFGVLAASGVVGWIGWNAIIFGDPLNFLRGEFAKPELWVAAGDPAVGDWAVAGASYLWAVVAVVGPVVLVAAAAGLGFLVWRTRLRAEALAPVLLLVLPVFYVFALQSGQRPLHVPQISGDLYNVRFGLVVIVPAALLIGYLAAQVRPRSLARCAPVAAGIASVLLAAGGIATLQEPQAFRAGAAERTSARGAAWLREHYDRGRVLMQSWNNETVNFESGIPLRDVVYEGSYRQWEPALADPAAHGIRWIHLGRARGVPDRVWTSLHGKPELTRSYALVYADADRQVYRLRGSCR
ncbi:glycosyltransferase family 39 protein [Saccharopolyspora indica]|uniref:glycosyltransferase family 39 protein n=1 Tax=Saccharopolyspora indica TaxID=1229659 RepID=UPI0022EA8B06|nr:glycosyltransferase family 39 protein [Saccharopolyspora indica]MDA3644539.1 glycosyltransferase family 39 protein [Saccharopolyspora indica]